MNELVSKKVAKFLKPTLKLPASTLPVRTPAPDLAKYLTRCTGDLYAWQRTERSASNTFVLHDGPPYANGDLHVGHALNKIVKDMICRVKLSEGKRIDYVPGWDCHGLPIENKVKRTKGDKDEELSASEVRSAAKAFAASAVKSQMKSFKSWGIMADWDNHWKTMDKDFELRQLRIFKALAAGKLIYRKHKPVYWSPSSQTALAEAELDYKSDHVSTAVLVKFPLSRLLDISPEPLSAVIFTTTPWTLPANQAIAIHKDIQYVIVRSQKHGMLVVAQKRISYLQEQLSEEVELIKAISAEDLMNSTYSGLRHFGDDALDLPVFHADFVKEDSGTGLVHCAPGHGKDDYEALQPLVLAGRVKVKAPVDDSGRFSDAASPGNPSLLSGQEVFGEGTKSVLKLLGDEGVLLSSYKYTHSYPIDWRTKKPVMTRATAQWFADVSSIKHDTLNSLKQVTFQPITGESRLKSFVENRSEWCISRQRAWGVPIPAIYYKDSGQAVLTPESIDHILNVIGERGIDRWFSDPADDRAWIAPCLGAREFVRGRDTMDVWFDSGTSWSFLTQLDDPDHQAQPVADVYLEGSDQHRGWFQSSLLTSVAYQKMTHPDTPPTAPFRQLVTHGFTLDAEGRKMSKSEGNVVEPSQIIAGLAPPTPSPAAKKGKQRQVHSLGPDALRLWAASSDWTKDVVISEKVVTTVHKQMDKYRVTMKLLTGMLSDFDPEQVELFDHSRAAVSQLDEIALFQLHRVVKNVRQALQANDFHKAVAMVNEWIANDLSAFYIESIKDTIYCESRQRGERLQQAQFVLYHIFSQLQHMLAPITPLLVEESHEHSPETVRKHGGHPLKRVWAELPTEWNGDKVARSESKIMRINSAVKAAQEEARAQKLLGQSLASNVYLPNYKDEALSRILPSTWEEIFVVSTVHFGEPPKDCEWKFSSTVTGLWSEWNGAGAEAPREGWVWVTSPQKEKCMRCWKYNLSEPERRPLSAELMPNESPETSLPERISICERCHGAVEDHKTLYAAELDRSESTAPAAKL